MTTPKELIESLPARTRALRGEVAQAIVGQERVVEDVLLGLYCGDRLTLEWGLRRRWIGGGVT